MEFETLIQQPESRRDDRWEAQFLDGLIPRRVDIEGEEPTPGPDGWPYLKIRVGSAEGTEPFARVIRWLATRGIGLVVNAHKMMPDYVFTYGMIWNFNETGLFVRPDPTSVEPIRGGVITGPPTEKYLPPYVRGILGDFLKRQGFAAPKILVVTSADFKETDLLWSVESLGNLGPEQHPVLAEALSWFLPQHYALRFVSERDWPPFHSL